MHSNIPMCTLFAKLTSFNAHYILRLFNASEEIHIKFHFKIITTLNFVAVVYSDHMLLNRGLVCFYIQVFIHSSIFILFLMTPLELVTKYTARLLI